jgi:hypothetical protein
MIVERPTSGALLAVHTRQLAVILAAACAACGGKSPAPVAPPVATAQPAPPGASTPGGDRGGGNREVPPRLAQ